MFEGHRSERVPQSDLVNRPGDRALVVQAALLLAGPLRSVVGNQLQPGGNQLMLEESATPRWTGLAHHRQVVAHPVGTLT